MLFFYFAITGDVFEFSGLAIPFDQLMSLLSRRKLFKGY